MQSTYGGAIYGGLVVIHAYAGSVPPEEFYLITQNNIDILTQMSLRIHVQPED